MSNKESAEILKIIEKKLSTKSKKHKYELKKEFDACSINIKEMINSEFIKESDKLKTELQKIINFFNNDFINTEIQQINDKINILCDKIQENIITVKNVKNKIKTFLQKRTEIQKKINDKLEEDTGKIQDLINKY